MFVKALIGIKYKGVRYEAGGFLNVDEDVRDKYPYAFEIIPVAEPEKEEEPKPVEEPKKTTKKSNKKEEEPQE